MAFLPYVRLVASGTLHSTQTWSVGCSFSNDGTATSGNLSTWLAAAVGPTGTFFTAVAAQCWDTTTNYTALRAYLYPALGGASSTAGVSGATVTGTGASTMSPQTALVMSYRSGVAGRKGRGRMYLPVTTNAGLGSGTGQFLPANATTIATAGKTWLDAMNALSIGTSAAIASIASRDSGLGFPIVSLIVDTKLDTQRRRTDKIVAVSRATVNL